MESKIENFRICKFELANSEFEKWELENLEFENSEFENLELKIENVFELYASRQTAFVLVI